MGNADVPVPGDDPRCDAERLSGMDAPGTTSIGMDVYGLAGALGTMGIAWREGDPIAPELFLDTAGMTAILHLLPRCLALALCEDFIGTPYEKLAVIIDRLRTEDASDLSDAPD